MECRSEQPKQPPVSRPKSGRRMMGTLLAYASEGTITIAMATKEAPK